MSLLKKIDYYYELATFKLAQVIDKTKVHPSSIDPYGDRVAVSDKKEWDFTPKKVPQNASSQNNKPLGVWYAFGTDWITLIEIDDGNAYRLKIDDSRILKINPSNLKDFLEKFSTTIEGEDLARSMGIDVDNLPSDKRLAIKYMFSPKSVIDWGQVATQYQGAEITGMSDIPMEVRHKYKFLSSWDIDSGCIWDTSAIKDVKNLGELPSFENDEDSRSSHSGYWDEESNRLKRLFGEKSGAVLGSSLDSSDLRYLAMKLTQYNIHLMPDQLRNVEFLASPSSVTLKKVPDAPSHEGKVINF